MAQKFYLEGDIVRPFTDVTGCLRKSPVVKYVADEPSKQDRLKLEMDPADMKPWNIFSPVPYSEAESPFSFWEKNAQALGFSPQVMRKIRSSYWRREERFSVLSWNYQDDKPTYLGGAIPLGEHQAIRGLSAVGASVTAYSGLFGHFYSDFRGSLTYGPDGQPLWSVLCHDAGLPYGEVWESHQWPAFLRETDILHNSKVSGYLLKGAVLSIMRILYDYASKFNGAPKTQFVIVDDDRSLIEFLCRQYDVAGLMPQTRQQAETQPLFLPSDMQHLERGTVIYCGDDRENEEDGGLAWLHKQLIEEVPVKVRAGKNDTLAVRQARIEMIRAERLRRKIDSQATIAKSCTRF